MRLAIELYGTLAGTVEGAGEAFDFAPTQEGMRRFGTNSSVLSVAIPLVLNQRRDQVGRRRDRFAELLPEGDQYDHMLTQSGIRRGDAHRCPRARRRRQRVAAEVPWVLAGQRGRRKSVASGGRVRVSDCGWPCHGCCSVVTAPRLPWPLPP